MDGGAFSKYHPAVNFLFFLGAIGCGVVIMHPGYLLISLLSGGVYYLLLHGRRGWRMLLSMIPLFMLLTGMNPLFNTYGQTVLFRLWGRPYTLEAQLYGASLAAMFVNMTLWFGCYNQVLTGDKFTSLFADLAPALSLLLVMVLRLVPNFIRKIKAIAGAREAIGKGVAENASKKERLRSGLAVLGALTDWALEGSVVTGDSMRARGYGTAKRTSFMHYRWGRADVLVLCVQSILFILTVLAVLLRQTAAEFTPEVKIAPVSWGMAVYGCYLLIPTVLQIKETILWRISRSKI